ncbi:bifunctional helix-turn-helix domain-containing protein/methylated-DNA--[protein]-cysteine S-methyltransferase [Fundidesulfovibrio terrae]|uniref:bifunctional helix-turn-helix domain-containing protein/methylated-DNA--[protein]-cysteine S-methyltransferase n=1 Tax=Fundidesulfovibrio terrae TaxID=2922866 RepID=UPI001FAF0BE9|nr:bifunctional helix-turn-helix domain-containing protein/methylated-DNA--[protein]-cysteine S-methyltransferase [Fundidesulfovibrio terrae]
MTTPEQQSKAYETVAEAIRYVRGHARVQPTLEDVAAHVSLSPHHLQRVFSAWAGISPKRFLQFLTKQSARELLRASRDVLRVSTETGLSGPGRLHDLMVSCEAMTPGEVGALGAGTAIAYGFSESPFGRFLAGATPRGVCHLRFVAQGEDEAAEAELRAEWPRAAFIRDDAQARALSGEMFGDMPGTGDAQRSPLRVLLKGTNFQIKVWEALLRIAPGQVTSYSGLASAMGMASSHRAVAGAVAKNPVAFLIPCHRVIRESGDFNQYRWGIERKTALLAWEHGLNLQADDSRQHSRLPSSG